MTHWTPFNLKLSFETCCYSPRVILYSPLYAEFSNLGLWGKNPVCFIIGNLSFKYYIQCGTEGWDLRQRKEHVSRLSLPHAALIVGFGICQIRVGILILSILYFAIQGKFLCSFRTSVYLLKKQELQYWVVVKIKWDKVCKNICNMPKHRFFSQCKFMTFHTYFFPLVLWLLALSLLIHDCKKSDYAI